VVITSSFRTENGNIIDTSVTKEVINYANAFTFVADKAFGSAGALNVSEARLNPTENRGTDKVTPYIEFVLDSGAGAVAGRHDDATTVEDETVAQLGTVRILHNPLTNYALAPSTSTQRAHINRISLAINGDMNAFDDVDGL